MIYLPLFNGLTLQIFQLLSFADDTSVIINELNFIQLERKLCMMFRLMNEWFKSLNFDKTCFVQFIAKNKFINKLNIEYDDKLLSESNEVKFSGMTLDNTISWKKHINSIISKLTVPRY
jgi:hypothetical protein